MVLPEMKKPPQDYQNQQPLNNRYQDAKKTWDERIGDARVQAKNWRLIALTAIVLGIVLAIGLIFQSTKSKIIPYMVRVNNDGSAQNAGPIPAGYRPQLAEIKYFLNQFVQKTRTIPLDPVVAKQNWLNAYGFLRPAAAMKMNDQVKKENPFALIGQQTRQVEINIIVPMTENTYQVRWNETVFDRDGMQQDQYKMTGLFTIDLNPPSDEKVLNVNPLGIYIRDFNLGRENN